MNLLYPTYSRFLKSLAGCFVLLLFLVNAQAQPGAIDPTFNPDDPGFGTGVGASSTVRAVVLQPDGKILIGGAFATYHGLARSRIARLNPDGSLDLGFNVGTGANGDVRVIVLQEDGKILIGGNFTTYNGTPRARTARLNQDGSLDTNYDPGTGANGIVHALAIQEDGKILIGGAFTIYNDTEQRYLARLNTDGTLDNNFDIGTGPGAAVQTITLLPDDKILIGGAFTSYNGTTINRIARLNADGSLGTDFNPGTGASGIVYSSRVLEDGKILIGGAFTTYNGIPRARIARLNPNGSLDTGFFPGTGASSTVHSVVQQSNGRILIGGEFTTYNGTARSRLARLNADGTLDTSFDTGAGGIVYSVALQNDNRVLIGGAFSSYFNQVKNRVARLEPDGNLDEDFDPGAGANGVVYATTVLADGRILIGGAFTSYNGIPVNRIARLLPTGALDATFQPGAGAGSDVRTLGVQPDGKILIGGSFTSYRGVSRNYIARLNSDGSLDNTFDPAAGANGVVHTIALQADGKIIIGGAFTTYRDVARNRIARLNANGTLDTSFDPGTGAGAIVYSAKVQPDGRILIGGTFTTYNGTGRNRIARLNPDGSLDASFTPGTAASADIRALAIQNDGKIVIGGNFTTYNGTTRNRVARLNADGSLDTGFTPGAGAAALVHSLLIQSDGEIVIGGDFITYNGTARVRFARLNADGTLDAAFNPGTGASGTVHTIAMQPNGQLLIGGAFTSYDGTGRNRVARVLNDFNPLSAESELEDELQVLVFPNPSRGDVYVQFIGQEAGGALKLQLFDVLGRQVLTEEIRTEKVSSGIKLKAASLASGVYHLRMSTGGRNVTKKIILTD